MRLTAAPSGPLRAPHQAGTSSRLAITTPRGSGWAFCRLTSGSLEPPFVGAGLTGCPNGPGDQCEASREGPPISRTRVSATAPQRHSEDCAEHARNSEASPPDRRSIVLSHERILDQR